MQQTAFCGELPRMMEADRGPGYHRLKQVNVLITCGLSGFASV